MISLLGCEFTRLRSYKATKLWGHEATWLPSYKANKASRLRSYEAMKLRSYENTSYEATKLWVHEATKLRAMWLWIYKASKLRSSKATKLRDSEAMRLEAMMLPNYKACPLLIVNHLFLLFFLGWFDRFFWTFILQLRQGSSEFLRNNESYGILSKISFLPKINSESCIYIFEIQKSTGFFKSNLYLLDT